MYWFIECIFPNKQASYSFDILAALFCRNASKLSRVLFHFVDNVIVFGGGMVVAFCISGVNMSQIFTPREDLEDNAHTAF